MRRGRLALLLLALSGLAAGPGPALSATPQTQAAAACASCHLPAGSPGASPGIPSIADLDEDQIARMMLAYRSAAPVRQIMQIVARALTEPEIAAVAHELAGQRPVGTAAR